MARIRFTARAREDLRILWLGLAGRSEVAADRLYDAIEARCGRLAAHPELGPARPDIAPEARSLTIGKVLVLYRLVEADVEVVRIVPGMRDLAALDWT